MRMVRCASHRLVALLAVSLIVIPTLQGMASPALAQPSHDLRSRAGALPGSNGRIAFQSNRTGVLQVFGMNPNGSSQTQMTRINDRSYDAAWYPDGTGLAFANCCAAGNSLEIYSMNWNGTGVTRLTANAVKDALPSWS